MPYCLERQDLDTAHVTVCAFASQHLAQGQPLVSGSSYYGNWMRPISGGWALARGPTFIQEGQESGKPQQGLVGGSLGRQVYVSIQISLQYTFFDSVLG